MMIRRTMSKFLIYLIVIINPYDGIDYDNILIINFDIPSNGIEIIEPEPHEYEKDPEPTKRVEMQFCLVCNPPKFMPVEIWEF